MQFKINILETAKGFANMGPGVIYINRTSNMITFTDDELEEEEEENFNSYDSSTDVEYSHFGQNFRRPKCECGAVHTKTPHLHSDWCPMYNRDQMLKKTEK